MRLYKLILSGLLLSAVLVSCDKYDDAELLRRIGSLDETAAQQASRSARQDSLLSDLSNLPTGIIMPDSTLGDAIKDDTLSMRILVNPSDFPLRKEHLSIIATHDIFTKINFMDDVENTTFDESVKSDFKIIGLQKDESYEGAYKVSIQVKGEGNYFDDAQLWLLARDLESKEDRYVISNTGITVFVLPNIEEGITVNSPQQSFYMLTANSREIAGVKPHYAGLWSNKYRNRAGMIRFYDRSKITSIQEGSDVMKADNTFGKDEFDEYGIIEIKPNKDSDFWKEAIEASEKGEIDFKDAEASVKVCRGKEVKTLDIPYRSYMRATQTINAATTRKQFNDQGNKFTFTKQQYAEKMGYNEDYEHFLFETEANVKGFPDGNMSAEVTDDGNLTLMTWIPSKTSMRVLLLLGYEATGGQDKSGNIKFFEKGDKKGLVLFFTDANVSITDD